MFRWRMKWKSKSPWNSRANPIPSGERWACGLDVARNIGPPNRRSETGLASSLTRAAVLIASSVIMKTKFIAILAGVTLGLVGCISNVAEPNPGVMPGYLDRVDRRFDRPLNQVFEAAKRALNSYGTITAESAFATATNQVRTVSGSVNQTKVWMRIEGVTPTASVVIVQVRAKMGGTDLTLANDLESRIALELAP